MALKWTVSLGYTFYDHSNRHCTPQRKPPEIFCLTFMMRAGDSARRVATSNAGQVLFSGIARRDRAARVARQLLEANFFSGWGVRTVAVGEARYNPMSTGAFSVSGATLPSGAPEELPAKPLRAWRRNKGPVGRGGASRCGTSCPALRVASLPVRFPGGEARERGRGAFSMAAIMSAPGGSRHTSAERMRCF
jgi:hypothetical protein